MIKKSTIEASLFISDFISGYLEELSSRMREAYPAFSFTTSQEKWLGLVLTGILLTNLNYYPINIYFHGLGVVGWTVAGYLSKDKAILTNFGLQIPLFLIGFYKIIS